MTQNLEKLKISNDSKFRKAKNLERLQISKISKIRICNKNESFVRFSLVFETSSKDSQINFPSTKYFKPKI
jgi:hypothetical protein